MFYLNCFLDGRSRLTSVGSYTFSLKGICREYILVKIPAVQCIVFEFYNGMKIFFLRHLYPFFPVLPSSLWEDMDFCGYCGALTYWEPTSGQDAWKYLVRGKKWKNEKVLKRRRKHLLYSWDCLKMRRGLMSQLHSICFLHRYLIEPVESLGYRKWILLAGCFCPLKLLQFSCLCWIAEKSSQIHIRKMN